MGSSFIFRSSCVATLLLLLTAAGASHAAGNRSVFKGRVTVVIEEKPHSVVQFALGDLLNALTQKGANVTVVRELPAKSKPGKRSLILVVGRVDTHPLLGQWLSEGKFTKETHPEGYTLGLPGNGTAFIAGADDNGTAYGVWALMYHFLDQWLQGEAFEVRDYPRFERRATWAWHFSCTNLYAYVDNMARARLNWLTMWFEPANYPPKDLPALIEHAHSRGIRVVVGIDLGWMGINFWEDAVGGHYYEFPDNLRKNSSEPKSLCPSSEENAKIVREKALDVFRKKFYPAHPDGVYYEVFSESGKCECELCKGKTYGELYPRWVNPFIAEFKQEFPDLLLLNGIHGGSFEEYASLSEVDPRATLLIWEHVIRGDARYLTLRRQKGRDAINYGVMFYSDVHGDWNKNLLSYTPDQLEKDYQSLLDERAREETPEKRMAIIEERQAEFRFYQSAKSIALGPQYLEMLCHGNYWDRIMGFRVLAHAQMAWNPYLSVAETLQYVADREGPTPRNTRLEQYMR